MEICFIFCKNISYTSTKGMGDGVSHPVSTCHSILTDRQTWLYLLPSGLKVASGFLIELNLIYQTLVEHALRHPHQ